ncbi:DinB family protein [Kibdelosporangium lantanae]
MSNERTELLAELALARAALVRTTKGLSDEQAGERPTVSELCLGGLVKHVGSIEEGWVRFIVEGTAGMSYPLPEGVTWEDLFMGTAREYPQWAIDSRNNFRMRPGETLAEVLEHYERIAANTEKVVTDLPDLEVTHLLPEAPWNPPGEAHSARRVLIHVIAETAQHAGHADILRESLDGQKST